MDSKACATCVATKPLSSFWRNNKRKDGRCASCAECMRAYEAQRGEAKRAYNKEYVLRTKEKRRAAKLTKKYGITAEEYKEMAAEQGNCCFICGSVQLPHLAVDHCHATGAVRKLLCTPCNTGLGCFKDDPALLELARSYLVSHSDAAVR